MMFEVEHSSNEPVGCAVPCEIDQLVTPSQHLGNGLDLVLFFISNCCPLLHHLTSDVISLSILCVCMCVCCVCVCVCVCVVCVCVCVCLYVCVCVCLCVCVCVCVCVSEESLLQNGVKGMKHEQVGKDS